MLCPPLQRQSHAQFGSMQQRCMIACNRYFALVSCKTTDSPESAGQSPAAGKAGGANTAGAADSPKPLTGRLYFFLFCFFDCLATTLAGFSVGFSSCAKPHDERGNASRAAQGATLQKETHPAHTGPQRGDRQGLFQGGICAPPTAACRPPRRTQPPRCRRRRQRASPSRSTACARWSPAASGSPRRGTTRTGHSTPTPGGEGRAAGGVSATVSETVCKSPARSFR